MNYFRTVFVLFSQNIFAMFGQMTKSTAIADPDSVVRGEGVSEVKKVGRGVRRIGNVRDSKNAY